MKISLIYPLLSKERSRIDENKQYWPPLGLAYIGAVLEENGHCVQILDRDYILRKNKFDFDRTDKATLSLIQQFDTDIIGFSATTANVSDVNRFSKQIKKANAKITTVIGGPHCIGEPLLTLQLCSGIDMLVRGEGERAMLDIASGKNLDTIGSLTYRKKDGTVISNLDRPLIESLDSLPLPARHLLDMDYYTRPSRFISRNLSLRTTHLFTARGCPYNCYYCSGPLMGRRKVRYHSPERVVLEIKELIGKYSIEAVYFAEDMFLSDKRRALKMANLFIENGFHKKIVWMAQVRTSAVDGEFLSTMKNSGCVHIEYGFESGSQRMLELMNKKSSVELNKKAAFLTKRNGLRFQGNFIVGYPGETEEDFNKTISFIKETRPNNVSLNLFMPLPGTEIYNRLKQENKSLSNWDDLGNPEAPYINYADMPKSRFAELYFNTKLRVVLPINLFYFLKDNICHPLRLFYIIITQFRSVIIRAFRAAMELRKINKKSKNNTRVLFIAYHSASYPIMESQGFSYMKNLVKQGGIEYSLLTFETKETLDNLGEVAIDLKKTFKWRYLFYHQNARVLGTLFNIFCGILTTLYIIKKDKVEIIHARGLISAVITFLPARILRVKFFFDTRGLLADKYVGGNLLRKDSCIYKIMRWGEDFLVKRADYFTVETNKHAEIIRNSKIGIAEKMEIIPSCVDMDKFNYLLYRDRIAPEDNKLNIVYLGKMGTWYLIEEMFVFFSVLSKEIDNAYFTFLTQDEPEGIYLIAERKGIALNKIIVKKLLKEEIPISLAQANIGIFFVNPYKRYNSSPIKYGEYLASGLPVVINSGIGDTDVITERENVGVVIKGFSKNSYEAAVKKLIKLLQDKEELKKRCRAVAEKYLSLKKGIEKYLLIYQRLLKE